MRLVIFLSVVLTISCSTASLRYQKLDLAAVESLEFRKTTAEELRKLFGNPQQIIALSTGETAWFYNDLERNRNFERARHTVNRNARIRRKRA